jgi:hypothetical protein
MPAARMTIWGLVDCWLEDLLALLMVTVGLLDGMGVVGVSGNGIAEFAAIFIYRLLIPRHGSGHLVVLLQTTRGPLTGTGARIDVVIS